MTSTHNTSIRNVQPKYIGIHYTAGLSSKSGSAKNTANYFATTKIAASADFIVDDTTIVQYNPDPRKYYCWAVGGKPSDYPNTKGGSLYGIAKNANTISIEICSNNNTGTVTQANDSHWYFTDASINNTIELVKYLMQTYNIPVSNVIRHYDVAGKPCPGIIGWNANTGNEDKWKDFKAKLSNSTYTPPVSQPSPSPSTQTTSVLYRVRKSWNDSASQIGAYSTLENAKKSCKDGYSVLMIKAIVSIQKQSLKLYLQHLQRQ